MPRRGVLFARVRPDPHRPPGLVPMRRQSLAVPVSLRPLLPDGLPVGTPPDQPSSIETFVSTEMLKAAMRSRTLPRVMPRISAARDWLPRGLAKHPREQEPLHHLDGLGIEIGRVRRQAAFDEPLEIDFGAAIGIDDNVRGRASGHALPAAGTRARSPARSPSAPPAGRRSAARGRCPASRRRSAARAPPARCLRSRAC